MDIFGKPKKLPDLVNKDQAFQTAKDVYDRLGTQYGVAKVPLSTFNGVDAPNISQANVKPTFRASGNITMATDATTYSLGINFNPSSVWFYGVAVHKTAGVVDMRAQVTGNAQLGSTYYFQPQSGTSVNVGGALQNVIQSSSFMVIDSTTNPITVRAGSGEGHIIDVFYPTSATIVARATITSYDQRNVYVLTSLASGWEIDGNFVVT